VGGDQRAALLPQRRCPQPEGQSHQIDWSAGTSSEAAYFAEIIEAVEKSCFQKGYTLILGNAWNDLEKRAYLSMMAQKRVDGLLVMCSEYPESVLSMLEEYRHIPMVVMDWGETDFTDSVIDNAFEGGYIAALPD
jgi:LacI family purine nucleotide synthesis repressor